MSAPDNLAVLATWKRGASATERLSELALYARTNPERFSRFVLAYEEKLANGNIKIRHLSYGCNLGEEIGLYELGKDQAIKDSVA